MIRKKLKQEKKSFYEPSLEELVRSWNAGKELIYDKALKEWVERPMEKISL